MATDHSGKMQTAETNNYVGSVVAPQGHDSIGRQQFEDARYQRSQEAKMKLVQRVQNKSAAMDFYFGVVIMINLLLMGFEADLSDRTKMGPSNVFWWIESVILMIFCVELYIRLQILSPKLVTVTPEYYREQKSFLDEDDEDTTTDYVVVSAKRGTLRFLMSWLHQYTGTEHFGHYAWLALDFFLVIISVIDAWIFQLFLAEESLANVSSFRMLRLLRVFRSIKLIRYYPDLWLLVNGLGQSMRAIGWVMMLLFLSIYVSALFISAQVRDNGYYMGENGQPHPDPMRANIHEWFGDVPNAMLTLFQVVTLEAWPDIVRCMMRENAGYAVFFVLFIITTNFTVMNLFIGVLVEYIQSAANTADLELMKVVKDDRNRMGEELKEVFDLVDVDKSGSLSAEEFRDAITNNEDVRRKVTRMRVQEDELDWLFEVLDADGSGKLSIQEFVTGVIKTRDSELACELMTMQNMILRELGKMEGHPKYKRRAAAAAAANGDASARKDTSTPRYISGANNPSGVSTSAGEPGGAEVIVGVEGGSTHELARQEQHSKESSANDKVRVTGAPLKTTENASARGMRPQRSFMTS